MLKMRELPEYQQPSVRYTVLAALALGGVLGASIGYSAATPTQGPGAPFSTRAELRLAASLCAQGYTVWADQGSLRVCGGGGWNVEPPALNPDEMRGTTPASAVLLGAP